MLCLKEDQNRVDVRCIDLNSSNSDLIPSMVISTNEELSHFLKEEITSAVVFPLAKMNRTLNEIKNNLDHCCHQMRNWNKINQGNNHVLQFTESCPSSFVLDSNKEVKIKNIDIAHKVFDEMSISKILKNDGTVQEYYEEFSSFYSKMCLSESCIIHLFISGLKPEIEKEVTSFEPKSLYDAYCLAIVQERANYLMKRMKNPPLSPSLKLEDANEVNDNIGLMILDGVYKENNKANEMEPKNSNNVEDKNNKLVVIDKFVRDKFQTNEIDTTLEEDETSLEDKIHNMQVSQKEVLDGISYIELEDQRLDDKPLKDSDDKTQVGIGFKIMKSVETRMEFESSYLKETNFLKSYGYYIYLNIFSCVQVLLELKRSHMVGKDGLNPLIEVKLMEMLLSSCMKT